VGPMTQQSSRNHHRVLVVESNPAAREVIQSTLKKAGYLLAEASNGGEAVTLLGLDSPASPINAIVCDIRAPKIKGIEAVSYFRVRYPQIPVIVTASYPDIEWAITLMKRGATDYLVKPVSREDLLMVVKSAVHRYLTVSRGSL